MNTSQVTFMPLIGPLKKVDEFVWRTVVQTATFEHTHVLWKGHHILTIKEHVDYNESMKLKTEDDDEDIDIDLDADPDEISATRPAAKSTFLIHAAPEWQWLKYNYGECNSVWEARELAAHEVGVIASKVRNAFALRNKKE